MGKTYAYKERGRVGSRPKHPGFKGAQESIMKREGVSKESAGAILAAGARHASAGAKMRNPRLKKV